MKCPNCGGELRFDIKTQKNVCDFCDSTFDIAPETNGKGGKKNGQATKRAKVLEDEHSEVREKSGGKLKVKTFLCPNCGGEIYATDTEANEFCSYCGSMVILQERIDDIDRPDYIIPFKVDKDRCREIYNKHIGKLIFAPKEFKTPGNIDRFRPIYTPYWVYESKFSGPGKLKAKHVYSKGNYEYTEHHDFLFDVDAEYGGISFDASSAFDDNTSAAIAPYDSSKMEKFDERYLSGFFADIPDVRNKVYTEDAKELMKSDVADKALKSEVFKKSRAKHNADGKGDELPSGEIKGKNAMFPVWFLSFRHGDRVSYAVVNGESGKITCDTPISVTKFMLFSLILAIPFFFLYNAVFMMQPMAMQLIAGLVTFALSLYYSWYLGQVEISEKRFTDKGYVLSHEKELGNDLKEAKKQLDAAETKKKIKPESFSGQLYMLVFAVAFFAIIGFAVAEVLLEFDALALAIAGVLAFLIIFRTKCADNKDRTIAIGILAVYAYCALVALIEPVRDVFFYLGSLLQVLSMLAIFLSVIVKYNILATRPLPQLKGRGHDAQ